MLAQLNFTRTLYASSVFLCAVAFVLLNARAFGMATTNDSAMTVLSMDEMESLAGGPSYPTSPEWKKKVEACQGFWSCPGKSKRKHRTCSCTGPPASKPCSTHWNGVPQWEWFHCKRNWLLQCSINNPTGASGGTRYRCNY